WSRYGQLLAFTDCSGYQTRYEYDRFGQMTAVHREEGISLYRHYDNRGRLTSVKDAQGRETRYEYNAAGDLTAVITPDGNRSETQYDAWGKAVSTTQGGLTRSMEYDAAGRVISLTNENGSHSDFSYDALDRLVQQGGFDGRTQRYHYDLTGKLTQSEDEGLITLWHYDASDRITHRTVNGDPAEQWQYDEHGWLTTLSHTSEGHRVSVHYGYDDKGRLTGERQTVENPETGELLWHHETGHAYNEQGLANRVTPDSLPPVEWLTYGSGYLAGMKLGGTPLVEYTRDRLHRETVRSFGSMAGSNAAYELTSTYTPAGQLQSQHLNSLVYDRDYGWSDNGDLVRISGPRQTREYGYSATGRLESVRTLAPDLDIRIPYATDPAGNRLPDPELQQHDEESGLYYNRHRHYDPLQGRYITPDPIGLRGGWNMYQYPLNPIQVIDPMGLDAIENMTSGGLIYAVSGVPGLIAANSITNSAYQFGYDMDAIVGGAHNGAADAMRHCYLMCRMTKTFGSTIADVIGKNHEAAGDRQGQPAKERIMDLKNNTVGIACGDFSAKCSDACIEKYNTGQLFGLDGIKADNPIKAKQGSSDASNY
ncbi:TPA: RHS repeat protein, partial [Escherichia coli]|nr:RHS repeat protein [Escherichia coli]HCU6563563.1 RHS repeat protein [Escherichia coli]HCU6576144.1 RHS repeat protein [Escherichia coli]